MVIRGHVIQLVTTPVQEDYLARAAGVARFAYNWALEAWQDIYLVHTMDPSIPNTSEMELRRELNALKEKEFPWMLEVTKCAPQMAIQNLGKAFKNFFEKKGQYPRFKAKGRDDRFTISNDHFKVDGKKIRLPHIGWVSMREELRFQGKILSATVSKVADRWFVSIAVESGPIHSKPAKNHGKVGVDLGVNTLATLWKDDGRVEKIAGPRPMNNLLPRLQMLVQALARKVQGSNSRKKARLKLARLYARMANIRLDTLHKLTSMLSSNYSTVVIEDLDVRGMLASRKSGLLKRRKRGLARSIADMGFSEFRRQLEYKMSARGGELLVADRYFPSSKQCSECKLVFKELKQGQQTWTCMGCKTVHDRDTNASHNLWMLG